MPTPNTAYLILEDSNIVLTQNLYSFILWTILAIILILILIKVYINAL